MRLQGVELWKPLQHCQLLLACLDDLYVYPSLFGSVFQFNWEKRIKKVGFRWLVCGNVPAIKEMMKRFSGQMRMPLWARGL